MAGEATKSLVDLRRAVIGGELGCDAIEYRPDLPRSRLETHQGLHRAGQRLSQPDLIALQRVTAE